MSQQASIEFRAGTDKDEIRFVELFISQIYVLFSLFIYSVSFQPLADCCPQFIDEIGV